MLKENLFPYNNRLLVKKSPPPPTKNNIILIEAQNRNIQEGVVEKISLDYKGTATLGCLVYFNKYAGISLEEDGMQDYVLLKDEDILLLKDEDILGTDA